MNIPEQLKQFQEEGENKLIIKDFHCSEHGYIKPTPSCPECKSLETTLAYELGRQEVYSENGANDMCEYWYQKGKKEMLEMVVKEIEGKKEKLVDTGGMVGHYIAGQKKALDSLKQKLLALNEE